MFGCIPEYSECASMINGGYAMLRLVRDARLTPKTQTTSFPSPARSDNHNPKPHSPVGHKTLSTSILLSIGQFPPDQPRIGLSTGELLNAINCMSRRMDDLARHLNCFGHFDDDDTPRAA